MAEERAYLVPELAERLDGEDLLRWAASAEGEVFREVRGRCTLRVRIGAKPYFLKRHLGVGWMEILKNWMVGKRPVLGAENEYRACRHLAARNLPAPRVAAFATEGGNPARRRSFVLCEELSGYDSLEAVAAQWADQPPSPLARRRLISAVARFVRRLHEAGVAHRDLYICHLMLDRQQWARGEARLAVLDLHRARLQPKLSAYWRKRDLAALLFSTMDIGLPAFSRLRFLRIYAGRPLREAFAEQPRFWRSVARRAQALHRKVRRKARRHGADHEAASLILEPAALMRLGRDVEVPFNIALDGEPCQIKHIFRLLPGRRLTALGHWRGGDLVVKLFIGAGAARYLARERRGVERMLASGTPTPRLLGDALAAQGARALLFSYLPDARPLAAADVDGAMRAVGLLAGLHGQGLTHRDPHLANFICSGDELLLVDGDGVGRLWRRGEEAELRALAEFLAQHPPSFDPWLEKLLAAYADRRNWAADADRLPKAKRLLAMARQRRVRRYLAKTERPCTEFDAVSNWRWRCLVKRAWRSDAVALAQAFAQDPEAGLRNAQVIKDGRSATVFRLTLGGSPVVVKRYNIKGWGHRLRRWFKRRALTAWRNGHRLELLTIPTAAPLALVERRWGSLTGQCYLIMEDRGRLDLAAEVSAQGWLPGRLDQVAALFAQLKAAELGHGDTKASNFLVHDGQVHLIDLDALSPRRDPAADLTRFLNNFEGSLRSQAEARLSAAGLS